MVVQNINELSKEYNLFYADPPWKQSKGGKKKVRANSSGKPLDYPTCSLEEIKKHLKLATNSAGGKTASYFCGQ